MLRGPSMMLMASLLLTLPAALSAQTWDGAAATGAGAASPEGEKDFCIPVSRIRETDVIDDRTILVRLYGGEYRRISLVSRCSGLRMSGGFAYDTRIPQLCKTEIIHPVGPVGATVAPAACAIREITVIGKEAAAGLAARN